MLEILRLQGSREDSTLTVTVSPKFQVVIPQAVREQLKIRPGQRVQVLVYGDRVELLPIEAPQALRGVLAGIETDVPRDEDRARMG